MSAIVRACSLAAIATLALQVGPAAAVTVPGDYPTIQAAVDAGAAQILVADGDYHEVVLLSRSVELLPAPLPERRSPLPFPRVDGLTIRYSTGGGTDRIYVRGFHFKGPVTQENTCYWGDTVFEACRLDSGFTNLNGCNVGHSLKLRGSLIFGDVSSHVYYVEMTSCTVVGGGATIKSNGNAWVSDNLVLGPAPFGMKVPTGDGYLQIRRNIIRDVVDGVIADAGLFEDNVVENCSGTGLSTTIGRYGGPSFINNVVRNCDGHGIALARHGIVIGNAVEHVGGVGIFVSISESIHDGYTDCLENRISDTGSHGIVVETADAARLIGNTVLRAGGDGIRAECSAYWNVVGRSVGRGIAVRGAAVSNTSYLNGGAGYAVIGAGAVEPDSVTHNIAYGNSGWGLEWSGPGTPVIACNDWFANDDGPTSGIAPGPSDLLLDPMFCDLPGDNVSLSADSPALESSGCGLIGPRGQGCKASVVVGERPPTDQARVAVHPLPSRGELDYTWAPTGGAVHVEIYDVRGALQWTRQTQGAAGRLHWDGRNSHGVPLASGVYFTKTVVGDRVSVSRVVLVR